MLGHVLIIDDSKMDRFIVEKMVERSKLADKIAHRELATLGLSYIQECISKNDLPRVIFLDINMPEMSGFEFLNELNKFPKNVTEFCAVVMLSSSLNEDDHKKAMSYPNVKMYCNKPISLAKIQELDKMLAEENTSTNADEGNKADAENGAYGFDIEDADGTEEDPEIL